MLLSLITGIAEPLLWTRSFDSFDVCDLKNTRENLHNITQFWVILFSFCKLFCSSRCNVGLLSEAVWSLSTVWSPSECSVPSFTILGEITDSSEREREWWSLSGNYNKRKVWRNRVFNLNKRWRDWYLHMQKYLHCSPEAITLLISLHSITKQQVKKKIKGYNNENILCLNVCYTLEGFILHPI